MRHRLALFVIMLPLLAAMAACDISTTSPASATPDQVDASILVQDFHNADGSVLAQIGFKLSGVEVQFPSGDTVDCNGVTLAFNALLGYAGRVPAAARGANYTFTWTHSGTPTAVQVQAQPYVEITSPTSGATITRAANFTIAYAAGSGTNVKGSFGDSASGRETSAETDSGTYTADITPLQAGPGTLGLVRTFLTTPSSAYHSLSVDYEVDSPSISVTWA